MPCRLTRRSRGRTFKHTIILTNHTSHHSFIEKHCISLASRCGGSVTSPGYLLLSLSLSTPPRPLLVAVYIDISQSSLPHPCPGLVDPRQNLPVFKLYRANDRPCDPIGGQVMDIDALGYLQILHSHLTYKV